MKQHPFLVTETCFWHHEYEVCGECGVPDKPDEPLRPFHLHHDEAIELERQQAMPRQWHESEEEYADRKENWVRRQTTQEDPVPPGGPEVAGLP